MQSLPMLFRRLAAFVYDSLLILAAFFIVTGIAVYLNDSRPVHGPTYLGVLWVVAGAFFVTFWRNGRTLGMQAWRLRVVALDASAPRDEEASPAAPAPPFWPLVVRYVIGSTLFGITLVWMLFDPDGLAVHDRLSRTRIARGSR